MVGQFGQEQQHTTENTIINQTFIKPSIELTLENSLAQKAPPNFAQAHSFAYADLKAYQTDLGKPKVQNY